MRHGSAGPIKKPLPIGSGLSGIRQRPILPGRHQPSTFGAEELNFCVRDGNRWDLFAIAAGNRFVFPRILTTAPGRFFRVFSPVLTLVSFKSSPRPISIIKLVRYRTYTDDLSPDRLSGVLLAYAMGIFILRWVSRLDAFSVYPVRTSLPCCALGRTTVAPVVRPFRSSRTRNSSSHDSSAHDG